MGYSVKEVFATLQGEGFHAGRAAVFVRFTGCNLWSGGREADRAKGLGGCAAGRHTDFRGHRRPGWGCFEDANALADAALAAWVSERPRENMFVVCTGGEPLLQLDEAPSKRCTRGAFAVAVDSNGTRPVPRGVDWVCVSPKAGGALAVAGGDELSRVPAGGAEPAFEAMAFTHRFVQPMDGPDRAKNTEAAVRFCLTRPGCG